MKKIIIIALAVILAGVILFFVKKRPAQIYYETQNAYIGDVRNTITATGKLQPLEQVEVSTQVSGTIDSILVDFNDKVKANQIIAVLDKSVLELQVSQSNASLSSAQSEFAYRKSLFERANALKGKNMISADDYELVKYNYERAQSSLENAKIDNSRAKTNLGYAIIRSPIDGVVLSRDVEQGQTVAASLNAPKLFTIARDLTQMQVLADIDEADIGQIKVGMSVRFSVDAWADSVFRGTVESIRVQPNSSNTTVTYTTVISADNSNNLLLPGMTATAEIETSGAENVLVIPSRALRFKPQVSQKTQTAKMPQNVNMPNMQQQSSQIGENRRAQTTVWILENDIPVMRQIQTGERSSLLIEVKSGLSENDKVIVSQTTSAKPKTTQQQSTSPLMGGGGRRR